MYKRGGSVGAATAAATTDHCTDEAARYLPLNTVQGRERLKHLVEIRSVSTERCLGDRKYLIYLH